MGGLRAWAWAAPVQGDGPMRARWPNAAPMANGPEWPRAGVTALESALGGALARPASANPCWGRAGRPIPYAAMFSRQASAPKILPRSTSARTNSYFTLSPSTRSRPSTRPPGPPAPRAPRRSGSCRLQNSRLPRFSVEASRCMPRPSAWKRKCFMFKRSAAARLASAAFTSRASFDCFTFSWRVARALRPRLGHHTKEPPYAPER